MRDVGSARCRQAPAVCKVSIGDERSYVLGQTHVAVGRGGLLGTGSWQLVVVKLSRRCAVDRAVEIAAG